MSEAGPQRIEGRAALAEAAVEVASRARREIALLSFELPEAVYGTPEFCDAVKDLVLTAGRHARVRILIQEPRGAATGHRLVTLGQHLSTYVAFRQPGIEHRERRGEYLIADERHLLQRQTPDATEAMLQLDAPPEARAALRQFNEIWDSGEPPPDLQRLYLG